MALVEKRKREKAWWMEEGEENLPADGRLEEAYEPSRLKPGYDGRNGPDVKTMYASKGEARFDDLGASQPNAKTPKKGSSDTTNLKVKEQKHIKEFADEMEPEMDSSMDTGMEDDMSDVPPEMMDDEMGDEMDDEMGEDAPVEITDGTTITIDGQQFTLTKVQDEEMGGDEMDPGMGDDGMDGGLNTDVPPSGEVGAEGDDVTGMEDDKFPESKKNKKVMQEAKNKAQKKQYVQKLIKMKDFAESELKELFTGDYVMNKQGYSGMDFTDIKGSTPYAVVAQAKDGKQYTVTGSDSPYEPGQDSKGQTGGKVQKPVGKTVEAFKAWLKSQMNEEETAHDAGLDSDNFNTGDTFNHTPNDVTPMHPDEFPAMPEIVGMGQPAKGKTQDSDPDTNSTVLTQTDTQKESVNARLNAVKKARMARRRQESSVVKNEEKVSLLNEELDFKKLMKGDYNLI